MKVAEVKAFSDRVAAIQRAADDKITAVFNEIRQQMGWPEDAQIHDNRNSHKSWAPDRAGVYCVWWLESGCVVSHPLGKRVAQALIAMGFPSGS